MLDAGWWANARGFAYLEPLPDPRVLYAVHMYEPWDFTNWRSNKGNHRYPGPTPGGKSDERWDRRWLEGELAPVVAWQARHRVPSSRIVAAEFGCNRRVPGAASWLHDMVSILEARGWHWAFYAFREDTWPGMDYEIGTRPVPAGYWDAQARGETPTPRRRDNPLVRTLRSRLRRTARPE